MNDIDVHITAVGEDAQMLTKCVRYLLNYTFLLKEKEEKLYSFAARPENRKKLDDYFSIAGYRFFMDQNAKICGIQPDDEIGEDAGVKMLSQVHFQKDRYYIILVLWNAYMEKPFQESGVCITMAELIDALDSFGIERKTGTLHSTLEELKKYNLISFQKPYTDNTEIRLYPSLMFGYNKEEFQTIADEILETENISEIIAESSNTNPDEDLEVDLEDLYEDEF